MHSTEGWMRKEGKIPFTNLQHSNGVGSRLKAVLQLRRGLWKMQFMIGILSTTRTQEGWDSKSLCKVCVLCRLYDRVSVVEYENLGLQWISQFFWLRWERICWLISFQLKDPVRRCLLDQNSDLQQSLKLHTLIIRTSLRSLKIQ